MNMIVAADQKWGIGNKGQLLVRIPADQVRFRDMTYGKIVIMGRKTFESLPGQTGLYGRINLVLTSDQNYRAKMADVVHSFEEVDAYLDRCYSRGYSSEDVFIIGGESIYSHYLSCSDKIYMTALQYSYEADTFFPDLSKHPEWVLTDKSDEQTYFDLEYYFETYERKYIK